MTGSSLVDGAEPGLAFGGLLDPGDDEIEVLVSVIDFRSGLWRPTAQAGELADRAGRGRDRREGGR